MTETKSTFIYQLFEHIANDQYVLLKWLGTDLDELPEESDLDVLVGEGVTTRINQFIQDAPEIEVVKQERKLDVIHYYLYFKNGDFLQLDLLSQLMRKQLVYLPNSYIWNNAIQINGIKACPETIVFEHALLFNYLNYSGLTNKYFLYYSSLSAPKQMILLKDINKKYNTSFKSFFETTSFNQEQSAKILQTIKKIKTNTLKNQFKYGVKYINNCWSSLKANRGQVITFSGVDGAGKSTIIQDTLNLIQGTFRKKVIVLRHRPSLLPIISAWRYGKKGAEQRSVKSLPRQGTNKNQLSSILRFAYYYVDYLIGQLYIWVKYVLRGYTVLYDRYYFDFIADGKRSNIQINKAIPKRLYQFLLKPDLNIFLYADTATILARKQELSANDIDELTTNYRTLFQELDQQRPEKYLAIENIKRQDTLATIKEYFLHL